MHRYDERALWLARNVLPHEPALRAWLSRRPVDGLDIDDIVQETYARLSTTQSVEDIRNPRTYLITTARSVILSRWHDLILAHGDLRHWETTGRGGGNSLQDTRTGRGFDFAVQCNAASVMNC